MTLFGLFDLKLRESSIWNSLPAMQHYLLLASDVAKAPKEVTVNKTNIHLERGQLAVTQKKLADQWCINTSKLRRELHGMERDGLISVKPVGRNCSIISVMSYNTDDICQDDAQTDAQTDVAFSPSTLGSQPVDRRTDRRTDRRSNIKDKEKDIIFYNKKKDNKEKDKTGLLFFPDPNRNYEEGLWD